MYSIKFCEIPSPTPLMTRYHFQGRAPEMKKMWCNMCCIITHMPSRNRLKTFIDGGWYHVYNRGVEKRKIFLDDDDYAVYLHLIKRYLGSDVEKDFKGREYPNYHCEIEVKAFCLMPNHYHILIYVVDATNVSKVFQSINSSYVQYFNKKYQRVGPLFQDRFKASHILLNAYLLHISRYIHLNPAQWQTWEYSSYQYYLGKRSASWVHPSLFGMNSPEKYTAFMKDYEDHKATLDEVKSLLA